jgi:hypothetical protein
MGRLYGGWALSMGARPAHSAKKIVRPYPQHYKGKAWESSGIASVAVFCPLDNPGENFCFEIPVYASEPHYLITRAENLNSSFNVTPIDW